MSKDKIAASLIAVPYAVMAWILSDDALSLAVLTGIGMVIIGLFYVAMERSK
jgi:hypothetical protein